MKTLSYVIILSVMVLLIVAGLYMFTQEIDENVPNSLTDVIEGEEVDIVIDYPVPESEVDLPIQIRGKARGNWFFEGDFPIEVEDQVGQTVATGIATADGDWMTDDFVPFQAELKFVPPVEATKLKIIFKKDNPSGDSSMDKSYSFFVNLGVMQRTVKANVFFPKIYSTNCTEVFPFERQIQLSQMMEEATLDQLLAGPTKNELDQGYTTMINDGVKLNSLAIDNGVARVDFDHQLNYQVAGSCRIQGIYAEIEQTLKQFTTINSVVISINGQTEGILEP